MLIESKSEQYILESKTCHLPPQSEKRWTEEDSVRKL